MTCFGLQVKGFSLIPARADSGQAAPPLRFSGGKPETKSICGGCIPHRHDEFVDVTDEVWAAISGPAGDGEL